MEKDWTADLQEKIRRGRRIYFDKDSVLLRELARLLGETNGRAAVLWAFELAEGAVRELETRCPGEDRPRTTLEAAQCWAAGDIRMPAAKREILRCHALAKELEAKAPADAALCHAVAQACSVVHTRGHALGFPLYELTALVLRTGADACREPVEARVRQYEERLLYWQKAEPEQQRPWASFLLRS